MTTVELGEGSVHERVARLFFETDPVIVANPWPLWPDLRNMGPVVESGPLFLITRYAGVKEVFRRHQAFSSDSRRPGSRTIALRESLTRERRAAWDEIAEFHAMWMVTTGDPIHARLREIVHRAFAPRRIAELEAATRRYVDEAIQDMADGRDTVDLMRLALDVPLFIVTDMLGFLSRIANSSRATRVNGSSSSSCPMTGSFARSRPSAACRPMWMR